jgi:flagellar biosynthesis protein FlhB
MLKVLTVNPVVTVLVALAMSLVTAVTATAVQVRPVFDQVRAKFSLSPPASRNRFVASAQRGVSMTAFVIGISVAALVVAIIVPIAFGQFFSVDTTSWGAETTLIWAVIPVVVILALVLFFLNKADDQA